LAQPASHAGSALEVPDFMPPKCEGSVVIAEGDVDAVAAQTDFTNRRCRDR
jgi:hypothetical protein